MLLLLFFIAIFYFCYLSVVIFEFNHIFNFNLRKSSDLLFKWTMVKGLFNLNKLGFKILKKDIGYLSVFIEGVQEVNQLFIDDTI